MIGYPAGTKCVITWAEPGNPFNGPINPGIGDIVTCGQRVLNDRLQEVDKGFFGWCCHPIAWMRPLEDPDLEKEDERELVLVEIER